MSDKELFDQEFQRLEDTEERYWTNWETATAEQITKEAVFCLMTPQSRATAAQKALDFAHNDYTKLTPDILKASGVRFHITKYARIQELLQKNEYICSLLSQYPAPADNRSIRDTLAKTVNGWGLKEASHFMRNIRRGENLAIIDRHIISCMVARSLIPLSDYLNRFKLNYSRYTHYEEIIVNYANSLGIPHPYLDMLWWASKSGVYFK